MSKYPVKGNRARMLARLTPAFVTLIALVLGGCELFSYHTATGSPSIVGSPSGYDSSSATATNPPVGPTIAPPVVNTEVPLATATPETEGFTLDATTQDAIDNALAHGSLSRPTYTRFGYFYEMGRVTTEDDEDVLVARYVISTMTPGGGVLIFVQAPFQGGSIVVSISLRELPNGEWDVQGSTYTDGFPLSIRGNTTGEIEHTDTAAGTVGEMNSVIAPGTVVTVDMDKAAPLARDLANYLNNYGARPADVMTSAAAASRPIVPASATPAFMFVYPYWSTFNP